MPDEQQAPTTQPERRIKKPGIGDVITFKGRQYVFGKQIGRGYFGEVYECQDEWGNQLAAKVLLPQKRSYEQVLEEWKRELKNLMTLRHPYITFVHAAFECDDTFYLVIERCDESLHDLITWPAIQPELWIEPLAKCLLQAIDYIHSVGYVHKDIHPGNVFVSRIQNTMGGPEDRAVIFKVGDLGLTKLEPDIDALNTMLAQWMLPPEAINPSEFGKIGKAVDIYHAGLLLLSLLLKRVPEFTKEEVVAGVPRQLAEKLESPFGPAISRALRRHVLERTPTALHFYQDLCASVRS